jgi:hypothetical protein
MLLNELILLVVWLFCICLWFITRKLINNHIFLQPIIADIITFAVSQYFINRLFVTFPNVKM